MAYCHERKFWEQSKEQKTRKKDKTNEGSRGEGRKKVFGRPGHPPYLRVWMTAPLPPPPHLSEGLDPPHIHISRRARVML